jgi:hypothetical protein
MVSAMFFLKVSAIHMRIDLSRRDVRVTEHFLYRNEVGAALQQVRGEAVPERMGRDVAIHPRIPNVLSDDLPRAHPAEWAPMLIQEDHTSGLAAIQLRASSSKVAPQHSNRTASEGDDPMPVSLAMNRNEALIQGQIPHSQADQLGDAKTGAIQSFQHREIPVGVRLRTPREGRRSLEDRLDLPVGKHVGEHSRHPGRLQALRRIFGQVALRHQESEVRTEG